MGGQPFSFFFCVSLNNLFIVFFIRVFTEVTFCNSAEYKILCESDFTSAEFRRDSAEFLAISCSEFRIRNLSDKFT
jgi:hypothetical protein